MPFLRPATSIARTQFRSNITRSFTRSTPAFKADTTPSTQGHVTQKSEDPVHKDKDIQSANARAGKENKAQAQDNNAADEENQPFDAARQGSKGGEMKRNSAAGTGAFMDQVGGQGAGGVKEGEKVDAAGESYTDMAKNVLTGNFGKGAKKSFHTSARSNVEPSSDAGSKSREPKNKVEPEGDQSGHLKHKSPEKPDSGKGNAAPEPHLPSKTAAGQQKRGYATRPPGGYSKTFTGEAKEKGYDVPPEALPSTLKSAYGKEATPAPDASLEPSHETGMASTSMDPPHKVLTKKAKQGTLADVKPPPSSRRSLHTEATSTKLPLDKTLTTKLAVRTSQPLTSILQAYAVLRAIESNYGQVMTFDVSRDPDSQLPTNLLFFTLAEPVNIHDSETLHEIPSPQSSLGPLERYGGPSLDDIRSILGDDYRMPKSKGQNQNYQSSITFRVEHRRTSGYNQPLPVKKTTPTTIQQDKRIAETLEKFGDGFFGAFKGLGEKHLAIANSKGRMRRYSDNKFVPPPEPKAGEQGLKEA